LTIFHVPAAATETVERIETAARHMQRLCRI
jgi:hypothetical protein